MEFQKFLILVKGMKSTYTSPNFLPDEDSIKVWYNLLKDIPYELLNNTIIRWISTERFPPTIADLRKMSYHTANDETPDWAEAWKKIKSAISCYGFYRESDALASMDDLTRQTTERIGWKELCMADIDNESTNRAQFRDIYNALVARREHEGVISDRVRIAMQQQRKAIE